MQVRFRGLEKSFAEHPVIRHLDLEIESGEFVVLVGPSGCGKSTLLRILAGLEPPSAGEIWVGHRSVTHLPPAQRQMAMVFQNYSLYPHMTVYENLAFALKLAHRPNQEIQEKVKKVAELLQIGSLLDRYPKQLSGGQRQRVALGRAIVRETPIILFDEPLSNLDAHLRSQMRAEIKALHSKLKNTVIYVTHDQVEAMTLGHRIAVMRDGRVEQFDEPLRIYRRPANLFVAKFIGSPEINILNLTHSSSIDLSAYRQNLPSHCVGIRPEDLRAYPKSGMHKIAEGRIFFIENLGSHFLYHIQVGQQEIRTFETPKPFLQLDQVVPIYAQLEHMIFFDEKTGNSLYSPQKDETSPPTRPF